MRTLMGHLLALTAGIASMLLVLYIVVTPVKAADFSPQAKQQSGFTTNQEADILTAASAVGALRHCAVKFKMPKFEVTAKTVYFDVLGPLFHPDNNADGRRDQLSTAAIAVYGGAFRSGTFFRAVWNDTMKAWRPIYLPMSDVAACEALDAMLRDAVTRAGNPFGYGPEFKERADSDA